MARRDKKSSATDVELAELAELAALGDAAKACADRACAAIDDALDFIEASNERIAAMEKLHRLPR